MRRNPQMRRGVDLTLSCESTLSDDRGSGVALVELAPIEN